MDISRPTLQSIIADYDGVPLTDDELELIRPELENYIAALKELDDLDLSAVLSGRLLRVAE